MRLPVLIAATLASCADAGDAIEERRAAGEQRGEELAADLAAQVSGVADAQALEALAGVLDAIDRAAIDQAQVELELGDDDDTLQFADRMLRAHHVLREDHAAVLDALDATPSDGGVAATFATEAAITRHDLARAGADVDRRYALAQVETHAKARVLVDAIDALAHPAAYAGFVDEVRVITDLHLDLALDLAR